MNKMCHSNVFRTTLGFQKVRGRLGLGFSLVEIVVAMGIFAFAAVAILGLYSVALKTRADSTLETRSAIIADEVFNVIAMSGGLGGVLFRDGPALQPRNNQRVNLSGGEKVLLGFVGGTTVPFGLWHSARGQDPQKVWENGVTDSWAFSNGIELVALVWATPLPSGVGLYKVNCSVRTPATLPLAASRSVTYTTLMSSL